MAGAENTADLVGTDTLLQQRRPEGCGGALPGARVALSAREVQEKSGVNDARIHPPLTSGSARDSCLVCSSDPSRSRLLPRSVCRAGRFLASRSM